MNRFVYQTLRALSLGISRKSFVVLESWYQTELFYDVYTIFSIPAFKGLEEEEQDKIYEKINQLRGDDISILEKKNWLTSCLEQLLHSEIDEDDVLQLKRKM